MQLRASDGTPIAATLYPAAGGPAPAVVLVHMLTRTRDDWRGFADRLQAAGATCLALDLRGHGGSGGAAAPSAAMALDVQAAVMWLAARSDVRTGAIALVGASFGATAALLAAGELPVVKAVALVSPAADYRGVRLDPGLRKYGTRPLLLVASTEDPYALRTVRALTEEAPPARQVRLSAVPRPRVAPDRARSRGRRQPGGLAATDVVILIHAVPAALRPCAPSPSPSPSPGSSSA